MFHYLKWTLYGFKSTMCQTLIIKKKSSSWQIAMFDRNKILLLVINQIQEPLLHVMMPLCWLFCYNSVLDHVLFLIFCTYSVYVKCLCVFFFNVALINIVFEPGIPAVGSPSVSRMIMEGLLSGRKLFLLAVLSMSTACKTAPLISVT